MHVVYDERHRRFVGEVGRQPVEGVEASEGWIGGGFRIQRSRILGEQCGHTAGGTREQVGPAGLVGRREQRLKQLAYNPERELAVELGRPRRQHAHASLDRICSGSVQEARLADPGRSLQQHQPSAPGASVLD